MRIRIIEIMLVLGVMGGAGSFPSPSWATDTSFTTLQNAVTVNGVGTTLSTTTAENVLVEVTIVGTARATVQTQGSATGDGYRDIRCKNISTELTPIIIDATGTYQCLVSRSVNLRVPVSDCNACTVTVKAIRDTGTVTKGLASVALTSLTGIATSVATSSNVPVGGFIPIAGTSTPDQCTLRAAGGEMGVGADGVQVLLDCVEQQGSGMFFQVAQHDNGNHPKDLFSIRREGFTNTQGFNIIQGNYSVCGHPGGGADNCYYLSLDFARENSTARTWAGLTVQTDVHSAFYPVASFWGVTDGVYSGSPRSPIYQHYGTTFIHAGLYTATFGSKIGGTMLESLEDNGNHFSNNLVRTSSAYTNATTTMSRVGLLGAPVMSGRTYAFEAKIYVTTATGGVKFSINSTKTSSAIRYDAVCIHHAATPAISSSGFATALAGVVAASSTSLVSGAVCTINGTVTMSGGTSTELNGVATSASPTMTFASTTGVVNNQLLRKGTVQNCNTLTGQAFVNSFVADTSVTLSENAACSSITTSWSFLDTLYVEAASNAAGTLTIAQGSTFELKGSINGGSY